MKKLFILLCSIALVHSTQAQGSLLDSAKNELYRINQVFDSSQYLGFDIDILYKGDTLNINDSVLRVENEQMTGTYILNQKNLQYQIGSTEYIQTDSFSYTIYHDEMMMIMTKNFVSANSDVFPLKTFIDSTIQYYGSSYSISIDTVFIDSSDFFKRITFTTIYTQARLGNTGSTPYTYLSIDYDEETYFPLKFEFSFKEMTMQDGIDSSSSPTSYELIKTVTMNFGNYKAFTNTEIFDDARYSYFNRQRKIYEPAQKYKEYKFITSGFENEDADAQYYREVPYNGN